MGKHAVERPTSAKQSGASVRTDQGTIPQAKANHAATPQAEANHATTPRAERTGDTLDCFGIGKGGLDASAPL